MKRRKYSDLLVLILIGVLISIGVFNHFTEGYILSVNFFLGVICWVGSILLGYASKKSRSFILYLLLLAAANVLVFSASVISFGSNLFTYNHNGLVIYFVGLNPYFLLILIVYCIVNRDIIRKPFQMSEKESIEKMNNGINFYYDKFNLYTSEELEAVFKIYKEYPIEAQTALKDIHFERNLHLVKF